MSAALPASRLRVRDALAVAGASLWSHRLRATLATAGIAIGVAAMVAVLGVSASSRADLLAQLNALGTNLLTVRPGQSFLGADTALAASAPAAIRRIGSVRQAAATAAVDATVRRTDHIPPAQTSGIRVAAADTSLLATLQGRLAAGRFFDTATPDYPAVVLGATAARRLGIDDLAGQPLVRLDDNWFAVVGILKPVPLAPEIDSTALIGRPAAHRVLAIEQEALAPTTVYVRTQPRALDAVRALVPRTANPQSPEAVRVSRPSDALAARAAVESTFTSLLLALGGIALLVGGLGIANVMVVAVLERRNEIGVRRALGATRHHVRAQFLLEAVLLSAIGGTVGVTLGAAITTACATYRGWPTALPPAGLAATVALAVLVGAIAGLHPASRAANLHPAIAVRPR